MTTEHPGPPRRTRAFPVSPLVSAPVRVKGRFVSLQTKFLVGTLLVVASVMSALVLIVEWGNSEDVFDPVADLLPGTKGDLRRDRTDERDPAGLRTPR